MGITEKFEEHDIDGSFLVTMNKADLLEVGMSKLEARKFSIALKKILPIDDAIDSSSSSNSNNTDDEEKENKTANTADDKKKEQEAPPVPSDEDKVDEVKETKENSKDSESIKEEKIIGKDVNDATNKETTSEALEQADVQDGDRVGDVKNSNV